MILLFHLILPVCQHSVTRVNSYKLVNKNFSRYDARQHFSRKG